jgi:hypothetical protein
VVETEGIELAAPHPVVGPVSYRVRNGNYQDFNAGASLHQTDLSFPGKTVARSIARTGSALVHPVRAGPVPVHFAAGHVLGVPARAGLSLPVHYVWSEHFGAFAWAAQMPRHLSRPMPDHLART